MNQEQKVCTFLQAEKLYEFGALQISHLYWEIHPDINDPYLVSCTTDIKVYPNNVKIDKEKTRYNIAAFDVAELGVMLPQGTRCRKCDVIWVCDISDNFWGDSIIQETAGGETEAEGRAALLIYLIEKNMLKLNRLLKRQSDQL